MKNTLIVPAYNEQLAIGPVIEEYYPYVDELIIIDDGSSDHTYEIAHGYADKKVTVIRHDKNQGKVGALMTGIKFASGDIIIFTDADCTYPARYIPNFIEELNNGADLVLGSRTLQSHNIPIFNRLGNSIFSMLATYISGKIILDGQTGMRAFKKDLFNSLQVNAKGLEFETKMTVRAAKLGYVIVEIPIEYRKRVGVSKLHPVRDGYRMIRALLSIAWRETSPLAKMISIPGVIIILIGFLFALLAVSDFILNYYLVHQYYPLIGVFSILIGVQLASLGIIIDYLTKKLDRIEEQIRK